MMKRRQFIQSAGLLAASFAVLRPSMMCGAPSRLVKAGGKTGLQLYTLRSELKAGTAKDVLARVAAAGYKEVETYGFDPRSGFWGMSAKEFSQVLKDNGLSSPSGHYGADRFIARGGTKDDIMPHIEAAAETGQKYFTVPYLSEPLRKSADDYKHVAARLNEIGELCKTVRIGAAYHNHDFEFADQNGKTGYDILLSETGPDVKMELDIYWAVFAGKNPREMFEAHPGRFTMWHVKDMSRANRKENDEVGTGSIDYKEIFTHAKTAGLEHYFVEQENNYMSDIYQSIRMSADYLKTI
ncbi:MAG TPA: sugar phosphate isomerase/epimerase [Sphingobacteriaceae bacterium]